MMMSDILKELEELEHAGGTRVAKIELARLLLTKPHPTRNPLTKTELVLLKALMNDGEIKAICDQIDKEAEDSQ